MPNTTNFNFPTPADTDLVKDGASAIRSLGNSIDTAFVDLKGGTTGQILSKASNTDLDYTWIANDQGDITEVSAGTGISVASGTGPVPVVTNTVATTFDAKGDLVAGTGADTFAKLTVGANNTVLTADSSTATGLKWAAAASGGGFTLLETITIPSSTTTITSASISNSYKHLCFVFSNIFTTSGNNLDCTLRFNSDSGSNYLYAGVSGQDSSAGGTNSSGAATSIGSGSMGGDSNYNLNGVLWVYRYTDTTRRTWTYQQMGGISTGGNSRYSILTGGYKGSSAISTLTMARVQTDATFQGTIYIYGVA